MSKAAKELFYENVDSPATRDGGATPPRGESFAGKGESSAASGISTSHASMMGDVLIPVVVFAPA
jgi:hypothetical protein